jgi:hypothetical protein
MTADLPVRPEITPGYRREADREIRAFTRDWTARDDRIASLSYFGTFAVYFFTLWLAVQAWPVWWLVVPLIVVNAFAGVRLYVLQHDCGHGSLFAETRQRPRGPRAQRLHAHALPGHAVQPQRTSFPSRQSRGTGHDRDLHHDAARVGGGGLVDAPEIPALPQPAPDDPGGRAPDLCPRLPLAEERRSHRCGGRGPAQYGPRALGRGDLVDGR